MKEYFKQFFYNKDENYSVIVEANSKVCYAYLLSNDEIIGDVWLGNQIPISNEIDFSDPSQMPFPNPEEYLLNPKELIEDFEPILIDWEIFSSTKKVIVYFHNDTKVMLKEGAKPGWSNKVKKSGPLAKVIKNEKN